MLVLHLTAQWNKKYLKALHGWVLTWKLSFETQSENQGGNYEYLLCVKNDIQIILIIQVIKKKTYSGFTKMYFSTRGGGQPRSKIKRL